MSTGFSLGFKPTTTTTSTLFTAPVSSSGLPFSSTSTSAPLQFGFTTSAPLQFGQTQPTGSFNFGTPTTSSAPLGFGSIKPTTTSAGTLNFATPTATPATSLSFGASSVPLGFGLATPIATAAPKLSFGTPTLSFGTSVPGASTGGLNFGTGSTATSTGAFSFAPATTSLTSTSGLGGILTAEQPKVPTTSIQKELPPKEQPLPNEIFQTVESFKAFVKTQKNHSSDIARCNSKEYGEVGEDLDIVAHVLKEVEYKLQKNRAIAEKLKYDTAKGLEYVEMAQRTQETPIGLQYENSTPMQFFIDLVDNFEKEMQGLKSQLEGIDKYLKNTQQTGNISSQEISLGMKRLHETFVALAGRLQTLHSQVEVQKERYLNMRKNILNDNSDVFGDTNEEEIIRSIMYNAPYTPPTLSAGPTPFSALGKSQAHLISITTAPLSIPTAAPLQNTLNTGSSFSFGSTNLNFPSTQQSGFQLNKPPVGNKRGKM